MKINLSKGFITLAGHENKFITPESDEMYFLKKYFTLKGDEKCD